MYMYIYIYKGLIEHSFTLTLKDARMREHSPGNWMPLYRRKKDAPIFPVPRRRTRGPEVLFLDGFDF